MEIKMFKYFFRGKYMPLMFIVQNLGVSRTKIYSRIATMEADETKSFEIKNKKTKVFETVTVSRLS